MDKLLDMLDRSKPDWWIVYANQQELIDCVRTCTDGKSGTIQAKHSLRRNVSERLFAVMQVGIQWSDNNPRS